MKTPTPSPAEVLDLSSLAACTDAETARRFVDALTWHMPGEIILVRPEGKHGWDDMGTLPDFIRKVAAASDEFTEEDLQDRLSDLAEQSRELGVPVPGPIRLLAALLPPSVNETAEYEFGDIVAELHDDKARLYRPSKPAHLLSLMATDDDEFEAVWAVDAFEFRPDWAVVTWWPSRSPAATPTILGFIRLENKLRNFIHLFQDVLVDEDLVGDRTPMPGPCGPDVAVLLRYLAESDLESRMMKAPERFWAGMFSVLEEAEEGADAWDENGVATWYSDPEDATSVDEPSFSLDEYVIHWLKSCGA